MKRRASLATRLRVLREAFDDSFAAPHIEQQEAVDNFLAIRLGKSGHAIPLPDISGLFARRPITPLPTIEPALLGLANFSGTVAPVFDLHLLLGLKSTERPAWFAMATAAPVAFAFEGFEGHLRIPQKDIVVTNENGQKDDPQRRSIRAKGLLRPVVHLPALIANIEKRTPTA